MSDCHPKLIPIDKETNYQVVHAFGLGKTDRPADQPLDPRAQVHVLALDLLGVCLPHVMLRGIEMPFVGTPLVGAIARDAKMCNTRAVSRMPLAFMAISTICCLTSGD
jgi:hypothetical protein